MDALVTVFVFCTMPAQLMKADVAAVVSKWTGVPVEKARGSGRGGEQNGLMFLGSDQLDKCLISLTLLIYIAPAEIVIHLTCS